MNLARVETVAALRQMLEPVRRDRRRIGFVPTMGALHAGHARLIERARHECEYVVVSIFVNPLQFDREDDLQRYPRSREDDLAMCRSLGADVVFMPGVDEIYPADQLCTVDIAQLGNHLCGRHRPGHFRGVATVVLKLLQMVGPDLAYFGEKDAQQLAMVRRMVADFNLPVIIVGVPTVREQDGLALSSRNRHLDPCGRALAASLHASLQHVRQLVAEGRSDVAALTREAAALIPADARLRLEYLEIVDPDRMQPLDQVTGPALAAGALWVDATRLIDNVSLHPPHRS